jgi:pyridoxal phosphate enzyme (YggS family)
MDTEPDFAERLAGLRGRMAQACGRAGRKPDAVTLIAVTKTFGPEAVRDAWEAGLGIVGENRVQEAAVKLPQCVSGPDWHLIGHLQRNKVRPALELFSCLHAVDSPKLVEQIARIADEIGARPRILLEINASGESSKFGLKPEAAPAVIEQALALRSLTLEGLMTMAPIAPDPETTRPVFAKVRECRDRWETQFGISLPQLSMGMSGDFEVAIEEGATWIRIGTALFGNRPKWKPERGSEDREEQVWVVD